MDHFAQLIWKGAHKIGCARGGFYGEPWYVAHYDKAPIIGKPSTAVNIERPMQVRVACHPYLTAVPHWELSVTIYIHNRPFIDIVTVHVTLDYNMICVTL